MKDKKRVLLRITCRHDLDLVALRNIKEFDFNGAIKYVLHQYIKGTPVKMQIPVIPDFSRADFKPSYSIFLHLDNIKDADIISFLSTIKPYYQNAAIKAIFRASLLTLPLSVYNKQNSVYTNDYSNALNKTLEDNISTFDFYKPTLYKKKYSKAFSDTPPKKRGRKPKNKNLETEQISQNINETESNTQTSTESSTSKVVETYSKNELVKNDTTSVKPSEMRTETIAPISVQVQAPCENKSVINDNLVNHVSPTKNVENTFAIEEVRRTLTDFTEKEIPSKTTETVNNASNTMSLIDKSAQTSSELDFSNDFSNSGTFEESSFNNESEDNIDDVDMDFMNMFSSMLNQNW